MIHLCEYGCGQEAKFQFKNGKWCCSKNIAQCSHIRKKIKENHVDLRGENHPNYGKHLSIEIRNKMSGSKIGENNPMFGKHHTIKTIKKMSGDNHPKGMLGKHHTKEAKEKQRDAHIGEKNYWHNKHQSKKHRDKIGKKLRTPFEEIKKFTEETGIELFTTEEEYKKDYKNQFSKLKFRCPEGHEFPMRWDCFKEGQRCRECANKKHSQWMKINGQCCPNYNQKSCKLIDKYGKENNYNFQHAENGGEYHIKELGYWVDGYDKEKNVVIEIDEKTHFDKNGNLKEKDIQRQKEITEFLGCKFIRLRI